MHSCDGLLAANQNDSYLCHYMLLLLLTYLGEIGHVYQQLVRCLRRRRTY